MQVQLKSLFLSLMVIAFLSSCEKENLSPDGPGFHKKKPLTPGNSGGSGGNGDSGNGKGKGNKGDDTSPPPAPIVYEDTYVLESRVDYDPLFKFSFSQGDTLVLLQTDATVTTWGTDYWGAWSDPYSYSTSAGELQYFDGLTDVTYEFDSLAGNRFNVTKTLIVTEYLSGNTTTTVTNPGIYVLEP